MLGREVMPRRAREAFCRWETMWFIVRMPILGGLGVARRFELGVIRWAGLDWIGFGGGQYRLDWV